MILGYYYRVLDSRDTGPDDAPIFLTVPFKIVQRTPKGVKIQWFDGKPKLILHTTLNKPAQPTRELAMRDYLLRKRKHLEFVQRKLVYLRRVVAALENDAYTTGFDCAVFSFGDAIVEKQLSDPDTLTHTVTTL